MKAIISLLYLLPMWSATLILGESNTEINYGFTHNVVLLGSDKCKIDIFIKEDNCPIWILKRLVRQNNYIY